MASPQANTPSDETNEEAPPLERTSSKVARFFKWAFMILLGYWLLCIAVVRNEFLLEAPGRLLLGWLGYCGSKVSSIHLQPFDLVSWSAGTVVVAVIAHCSIIRIIPQWRPHHTATGLMLLLLCSGVFIPLAGMTRQLAGLTSGKVLEDRSRRSVQIQLSSNSRNLWALLMESTLENNRYPESLHEISRQFGMAPEMSEFVLLYPGKAYADETGPIAVSPVVVEEDGKAVIGVIYHNGEVKIQPAGDLDGIFTAARASAPKR